MLIFREETSPARSTHSMPPPKSTPTPELMIG
jgi:hypothetical protein